MVRISNLRANNITPHQARLTLAYNNTSSTNTQPTHTHRGQKEKIKERLHGQIEIQKKKKIQIKSSRSLVSPRLPSPRYSYVIWLMIAIGLDWIAIQSDMRLSISSCDANSRKAMSSKYIDSDSSIFFSFFVLFLHHFRDWVSDRLPIELDSTWRRSI